MPTYTKFKGVTEFGDTEISSQIKDNLKTFLDWGFLEIGAFSNVRVPTSGVYGGNEHLLKLSNDTRYTTTGRVWQSFRKDWVWESGIEYSSRTPIIISGVKVNNVFYPSTGVGNYGHVVDYPNGRVIFNSGLPKTAVVSMEYSYRKVQITDVSNESFKAIQYDSYRVDEDSFLTMSGAWNKFAENRIQLPIIGIEVVPKRNFKGAMLGGGHYLEQDINFYIYSENKNDRNTIQDILSKQKNKDFYFFNINGLASGNKFPLTSSGSLVPNALNYPSLIKDADQGGFLWKFCRITETRLENIGQINPQLFGSIVKWHLEISMPEV